MMLTLEEDGRAGDVTAAAQSRRPAATASRSCGNAFFHNCLVKKAPKKKATVHSKRRKGRGGNALGHLEMKLFSEPAAVERCLRRRILQRILASML